VLEKAGQRLADDVFGAEKSYPGGYRPPDLAIYGYVIQDIERVVAAIPAKTQAQQELDKALGVIRELKSQITRADKLQAR